MMKEFCDRCRDAEIPEGTGRLEVQSAKQKNGEYIQDPRSDRIGHWVLCGSCEWEFLRLMGEMPPKAARG